jgi:hypothetical protein
MYTKQQQKVGLNRLLKLADFLETKVPRKQFNMDVWKFEDACGTVGCALGWGCSIPSFRKAGLKLVWDSEHISAHVKYGDERIGEDAAEDFFHIELKEAEDLFLDLYGDKSPNETPKQVAKRIRKFVKEKQKAT